MPLCRVGMTCGADLGRERARGDFRAGGATNGVETGQRNRLRWGRGVPTRHDWMNDRWVTVNGATHSVGRWTCATMKAGGGDKV